MTKEEFWDTSGEALNTLEGRDPRSITDEEWDYALDKAKESLEIADKLYKEANDG